MADYYPLLVRAISGLAQNTGETRRVVYDRARAALVKQLRSVEPPLPEGEITRERLSLEEAIRRVEVDYGAQEEVEPAAEPEAPAPVMRPYEPEPYEAPQAQVPPHHGPGPAHGAPAAPMPPREPAPAPEAPAREAPTREAPPREAPRPEGRREPPGRGHIQPRDEDETAADRRPSLPRGEVRSRGAANGARRNGRKAPGGMSWQKIILWVLVAGIVLGGVAFAVVNRNSLFGGSAQRAATTPPPTISAGDQQKNADRVAQPAGDAARRTAPAARPATGGTQRALLYEESPGGGAPQAFEGTVTWRTETFNSGAGLPPDIGVRGEIQIPERRMTVSFTLKRNTDQTLPVSHTIEVGFTLPSDFPFGGIASVPGVRVKQTETAQGVPLAGISASVTPTLFLVGLSSAPADRQRNLTLLQTRPWLDITMVYSNQKRAIIAFEKGMPGEQAFNDAFSAWGELIQQQPAPAGGN